MVSSEAGSVRPQARPRANPFRAAAFRTVSRTLPGQHSKTLRRMIRPPATPAGRAVVSAEPVPSSQLARPPEPPRRMSPSTSPHRHTPGVLCRRLRLTRTRGRFAAAPSSLPKISSTHSTSSAAEAVASPRSRPSGAQSRVARGRTSPGPSPQTCRSARRNSAREGATHSDLNRTRSGCLR